MCKENHEAAHPSQKLLNRMKRTKSNRFNYAKRLEVKAECKSHTINILSLLSIIVSIYILAYSGDLKPESARFAGVFLAGISVVSLVISLESPVSKLSQRAYDAHKCAREISDIYGQLQSGQLEEQVARQKYELVLSSYDENHGDVDNWKTLFERKSDFPEDAKGITWKRGLALYWLSAYSTVLYAIFGIALVIFVWFLLPVLDSFSTYGSSETASTAAPTQN